MNLRVLVLTTQTPHHAHFIRELVLAGYQVLAVLESQPGSLSRLSEFESAQMDYEESRWFSNGTPRISEVAETLMVERIGDLTHHVHTLRNFEVAISFGTGWIKPPALSVLPDHRWNLHGGDPQRYRGLDSHQWAVYHHDPTALVTTLHTLTPQLDDGLIVGGTLLDTSAALELHQLRAVNTEAAGSLARGALCTLEAVGSVPNFPQAPGARYYSKMPDEILRVTTERYRRIRSTGRGRQVD
jgi:methionyl-tRNA formyltransferase